MVSHPAFDFIRPLLVVIAGANPRDFSARIDSLNRIASERNVDLEFVAAREQKLSAVEYESRIVTHRELVVNDNWHDIFNACIWLTFPKTKRTISERHVAMGHGENNRRPRQRDVLTLFDEAGLILCAPPDLCDEFKQLNETHRWKTLFVERRREFLEQVTPYLFGHGTLEQLIEKPHRGLTAKVLWLPFARDATVDAIDDCLATQIRGGLLLTPDERRIPMPLLGIPGWFAENEAPQCYDDVNVFRSQRVA
jgi:Protein of unknown function (DUF3025)